MSFAPPWSLSPSSVSSFKECPLAFRFSYLERLPEPPAPWTTKGTLVHRALELVVSGAISSVPNAVSLAAQEIALTDHLADAAADVQRVDDTLRQLRITNNPAMTVGTEYPLAVRGHDAKRLTAAMRPLASLVNRHKKHRAHLVGVASSHRDL